MLYLMKALLFLTVAPLALGTGVFLVIMVWVVLSDR